MKGAPVPLNLIVPLVIFGWILCFQPGTCNVKDSSIQKNGSQDGPPYDCKKYKMRAVKLLLKKFNGCTKELRDSTTSDKEYEEKLGCAFKCLMNLAGYLNEKGVVDLDTIRDVAAQMVPPDVVDPLIHLFNRTCHAKLGPKLDTKEENCKSFANYAVCAQNLIADIEESEEIGPLCIKPKKKDKAKP